MKLVEKINIEVFFQLLDDIKRIPLLNCIPESDKNKQGSIFTALCNLVGATGQLKDYGLEAHRLILWLKPLENWAEAH